MDTVITAAAAAVSALATVVLVVITAYYAKQAARTVEEMKQARKVTEATVDEMRRQREQAQSSAQQTLAEMHMQRWQTLRPVVYPVSALPVVQFSDGPAVDWGQASYSVELVNGGSGLATDLCGVLMGPPAPNGVAPRYFLWKLPPLLPDVSPTSRTMETGGTVVRASDCLAGYTLGPPPKPSNADIMHHNKPVVVARLNLSYKDIFGRKHASIFDYTAMQRWHVITFAEDIAAVIEDLDNAVRTAPSSSESMAIATELDSLMQADTNEGADG